MWQYGEDETVRRGCDEERCSLGFQTDTLRDDSII